MPRGGPLVPPPEIEAEAEAEKSESAESSEKKPPPSPRPKPGLKAADGGAPKGPEKEFAIFTLLDGVSSAPGPIDTKQLATHLRGVHQFLLRETSFADRKRYLSCPSETRASLYRKLEAQGLSASGSSELDGHYQLVEEQVDAFNLAGAVFGFFLPLSAEMPTASKFWGALGQLVLVR